MGRRETMTLAKFQQEYNQAPLELQDFADGAAQIVDCGLLQLAAKTFLDAKMEFEYQLRTHGVEVG